MGYQLPNTGRDYQPHEVVSALQKAIRRSQPEKAVYWAVELQKSGLDVWCWNRLKEILSEDIGPADRYLPATINALAETAAAEKKRNGGGGLQLVHAVILMATAPKTRLVAQAAIHASSDQHERLEIPDEALDKHTRRGLKMGRGIEHFLTEAALLVPPPEDLEGFYEALHDEYMAERRRRIAKDPTLPQNPWVAKKSRKGGNEDWIPPSQKQIDFDPETGEIEEDTVGKT
jgi:hypothetical protein